MVPTIDVIRAGAKVMQGAASRSRLQASIDSQNGAHYLGETQNLNWCQLSQNRKKPLLVNKLNARRRFVEH
jgi:hypothetical protein